MGDRCEADTHKAENEGYREKNDNIIWRSQKIYVPLQCPKKSVSHRASAPFVSASYLQDVDTHKLRLGQEPRLYRQATC